MPPNPPYDTNVNKKYQSIVGAGLGTKLGGLTINEQQNPPFIQWRF
ncbi:hypothetical protein MC7420_7909 [Coleofasciculus chthonoplastes PCC 7420]|uniref:Uncharacterized protein n=1 Tax=Coleofasciculus chthonoplastes PCC 7420 TaxID=118168 RepID=B4VJ11_9CYAN|nr:hypothetical protein MC7420_7909 [Coleofasciculus chthonoplastes PCC 7420]